MSYAKFRLEKVFINKLSTLMTRWWIKIYLEKTHTFSNINVYYIVKNKCLMQRK